MPTESPVTGFPLRHIGPDPDDVARMLDQVGYPSLDALTAAAIPASIAWAGGLDLPDPLTEAEATAELRRIAGANRPMVSMIGLGYHDTVTPAVIRRNVLESPSWYTAYTPYQPEISQGRLEALLNFQTMIEDLTGLPIANASLLDEPTAVAEAMALLHRVDRSGAQRFLVDADTHPQTLAVLTTRATPLGIELDVRDLGEAELPLDGCFGVLVSAPTSLGAVRDPSWLSQFADRVHAARAGLVVAADLLSLCLLTAPGEYGADVVVGSAQRFGVPMGFGGPHAGFIAVRAGLERQLPGRLVGVSVDSAGAPAYRLALQTREQHIRREKATSNICTAQVLLAVIAGLYAAYHGPEGVRAIAERVHGHAVALADGLAALGVGVLHEHFFDTVAAVLPGRAEQVVAEAAVRGVNLRLVDADRVGISTDEVTVDDHVASVLDAVAAVLGEGGPEPVGASGERRTALGLPDAWLRASAYLTHPVFHSYRSETAMMRYLRRLAGYDVALDRSMIPLGSCTMKLNAATEMEPITWPGFADLHPFAPAEQTAGYDELIADLESLLVELTGYDAVSLQPNAGSQGEFAGLLAIRAWHVSRGDDQRDVCLIPSSAHGTNAASAAMAGLRVVVVACDEAGNVSVDALRAALAAHEGRIAALMITYPSTHGVYEAEVGTLCALVHDAGGQVYVDGANLNALVGLAKPGRFGADVSHLNLHKTFCIPHGGGGPGVGPVGVRAHLAPFLPGHPLRAPGRPGVADAGVGPVSGAPWGSAGILPISWAYIRMMGAEGLTRATQVAVLAANYVARRLVDHFPVLYTGPDGLVAHECILDLREIAKRTGVTVDDVAKRLIDYGFHAPTMSFPVAGTLMVEPTESEPLAELDRFCDAMIAIRAEIDRVAAGEVAVVDSVLRHAPHTALSLAREWAHPYSRAEAAFPTPGLAADKYWPPVGRIDGAYGDRNLVCACPPVAAFASS